MSKKIMPGAALAGFGLMVTKVFAQQRAASDRGDKQIDH
jgi:hypothetical protein